MGRPGLRSRHSSYVAKTYEDLQPYIDGFRDGGFNLVVLIGSWGIGKSQLVRRTIGDRAGWVVGTATPFGLYSQFYKYRDQPMILDDIDSIYVNKDSVSQLKAIASGDEPKALSWNARNGFLESNHVPAEFTTTSPIMIICNEWKTLNRNVAALQDRAQLLHFEPNALEIHKQAGTWFGDEEIYEWFGRMLHRIETHSFRYYVKAAQLKSVGIPWQRVIEGATKKHHREILVEDLLFDESFASQEDRIREYIKRGGGSRSSFFRYQKIVLERSGS